MGYLVALLGLFGLRRLVDKAIALEDLGVWRHVSPASEGVRRNALAHFEEDCVAFQDRYPEQLAVLDVFAVENSTLIEAFGRVQSELVSRDPNNRRLYHGTSAFALKQIVFNGFQLPQRPGMFGKGLYFADTPLKSWPYSTVGFIMVCDVALGL